MYTYSISTKRPPRYPRHLIQPAPTWFVKLENPLPAKASDPEFFEHQLQRNANRWLKEPIASLPTQPEPIDSTFAKLWPACPQDHTISHEHSIYITPIQLGRGSFAKVKLAMYKQEWFAIKIWSNKKLHLAFQAKTHDNTLHLRLAKDESNKLQQGLSPLQPRMIAFNEHKAYMLQPLMLGDFWVLQKHLHARICQHHIKDISTGLALCLLDSVVPSLQHLHQQHLAHLDIKPDNILYRGEKILLADYGLVNSASSCYRTTTCLAPEHLDDNRPPQQYDNRQIDMWCLGFTALYLASKKVHPDCFQLRTKSLLAQSVFFQSYRTAHFIFCQKTWASSQHLDPLSRALYQMFDTVDTYLQPVLLSLCHPIPTNRWPIDRLAQTLPSLRLHYAQAMEKAKLYLQQESLAAIQILGAKRITQDLSNSKPDKILAWPPINPTPRSNAAIPEPTLPHPTALHTSFSSSPGDYNPAKRRLS